MPPTSIGQLGHSPLMGGGDDLSAVPPIATKFVQRNELTLCATTCREHMQQNTHLPGEICLCRLEVI
jgi:hypothetical protein